MNIKRKRTLLAAVLTASLALPVFAENASPEDDKAAAAELAKKLQNPVANLISVPIQNNWDFGYGSANAMRYTANIQPVVPFSLNDDWNLVTRTIVPVIYAESPVVGGSSNDGWGLLTSHRTSGYIPAPSRRSGFLTSNSTAIVRVFSSRS